jgi:hypothetical protein
VGEQQVLRLYVAMRDAALVTPVQPDDELLKVAACTSLARGSSNVIVLTVLCVWHELRLEQLAARRELDDKLDLVAADENLMKLHDEWATAGLLHGRHFARDTSYCALVSIVFWKYLDGHRLF